MYMFRSEANWAEDQNKNVIRAKYSTPHYL